MAERFGTLLLGEVEEQGLDEFLHELRDLLVPKHGQVLGIPILDKVLEVLRFPPPQQNLPRWSSPGSTSDHSDDEVVPYGHGEHQVSASRQRVSAKPAVVEVSASSASSILNSPSLKTAIGLYFTALAVLSPEASAVVYISAHASTHGIATRLYAQLLSMLSARQSSKTEDAGRTASALARDAMSHVHIFNPGTSQQFYSTLQSIPDYLGDSSRHLSASRSLKLIVIDGIDAFYWQDRLANEISRLDPTIDDRTEHSDSKAESPQQHRAEEPSHAPPKTPTGPPDHLPDRTLKPQNTDIAKFLQRLQHDYSCALIYTITSSASSSILTPPTLRLSLTSLASSIPPFAPHMSIAEAVRDREKRKEVVRRGECLASVVEGASGEWRSDVAERLRRLTEEEGRLQWRFRLVDGVVAAVDEEEMDSA